MKKNKNTCTKVVSTLSVITPFYNEEKEIKNLLKDFEKFEKKNNVINEYILINDCSTDTSMLVINNFIKKTSKNLKKKIKIYQNKKNIGWCKTLLKGYKIAKSENIIFIPGDAEVRLTNFYKNIHLDKKQVVLIERKKMPGRPFSRILISYLYRYAVSVIFNVRLLDYNSVIILNKKLLSKLNLQSNSFFISAEIIVKAFHFGFDVNTSHKLWLFKKEKYKSTSMSLLSLVKVGVDAVKTFSFLYLKN